MKRFITLLLCLMLVVSVLTACGSEEKNEKSTEPATEYATTSITSNATQGATEKAAPAVTDTPINKGDITMVLEGSITDLNQVPDQDLTTVNQSYQSQAPEAGEVVAILHTSMGDIKLHFFPEVAPAAVNNFIALAKAGKFDNTIFHRVMNNFMIQGGDYTLHNGYGGESIYGTTFGYETSLYVKNIRGALAMAHSQLPASNGSQFYINQVDNTHLDGGYTVFGQVYEGLDVVDAIAAVQTNPADNKPLTDVNLISVEITTY